MKVHPGEDERHGAVADEVVVLTRFDEDGVAGLEPGDVCSFDLDGAAALEDAEQLGHGVLVAAGFVVGAEAGPLVHPEPAAVDPEAGEYRRERGSLAAGGELAEGQFAHLSLLRSTTARCAGTAHGRDSSPGSRA